MLGNSKEQQTICFPTDSTSGDLDPRDIRKRVKILCVVTTQGSHSWHLRGRRSGTLLHVLQGTKRSHTKESTRPNAGSNNVEKAYAGEKHTDRWGGFQWWKTNTPNVLASSIIPTLPHTRTSPACVSWCHSTLNLFKYSCHSRGIAFEFV